MADEKHQPEHVSGSGASDQEAGTPAQKPTFKQKLAAHFKRFWWVHVLLFCAGVLIVVLPLIYVGVPNIVQDELNKSTIGVNAQSVLDPQETSVALKIDATAHSSSIFHPTIDPFNGTLYLLDAPNYSFGQVTVPSIKVQKNIPINIEQRLEITDMVQFVNYNKMILTSEEYTYGIKSEVVVHQPGLDAVTANYDHQITQKGLNSFNGFTLEEPKAGLLPGSVIQLNATAMIPNPSALTLEFGTVLFDVSLEDGTKVGNATLENFTLQPNQDNRHPTTAFTSADVLTATDNDGMITVVITGNQITNSAGQRITYFEEAFKGTQLKTKIDPNQALANAEGGGSS